MLFTCTLWLNLAWSVWMTAAFSYLYAVAPTTARAAVVAMLVLFVCASIAALRRRRWAVALVVAVAVLLAVRWLPMVAVNAWMFATGHPRYLDSPGTLLIVAINAALFAIPGLVLVMLYAARWRTVSGIVRGSRATAA